jgi:hypothetical protein
MWSSLPNAKRTGFGNCVASVDGRSANDGREVRKHKLTTHQLIPTNKKLRSPTNDGEKKEKMQSFCRWVFTEIECAHLYISPIENMKNTLQKKNRTKVPF